VNKMFCHHCGKEIRDNACFCNYCGQRINSQRTKSKKDGVIEKLKVANSVVEKIMPKKLLALLPSMGGFSSLVVSCVSVMLIVIVVVSIGVSSSGHDLNGKYYTSDYYLYSAISFSDDGTFTAENSYEYGTGTYKKSGSGYILTFKDGTSKSGNPVEEAKSSSTYNKLDLFAEKNGDGSLLVYVYYRSQYSSSVTYYAWRNKSAVFRK